MSATTQSLHGTSTLSIQQFSDMLDNIESFRDHMSGYYHLLINDSSYDAIRLSLFASLKALNLLQHFIITYPPVSLENHCAE